MTVRAKPDHGLAAERKQTEIYRAITPQQRLAQALRMNRTMRELMATGFRSRHPEWTDTQVKRAVADQVLYARTG